MKEFFERLLQARQQDPRQQELAGRGRYRDDVIENFGSEQAYQQDLKDNPIEATPIEAFIKRLLSIRGN